MERVGLLTTLMASLIASGCSALLYYPTRHEHVIRSRMPIQPEDVEFKSEDGTRLHGWYFTSKEKKRRDCTIVFFHGNAQNLTTHFLSLFAAPSRGYDYFIFDYRGYGHSEDKKPDPKSTAADGRSAIRYIHQRNPNRPIVIFGQSLGGAVGLRAALDLKDEIPPRAVIVDSTFSSYRAVAKSTMAKNWFTWLFQPVAWLLMSDKYAPEKDLKKLPPVPLLVIHGDQDKTVDFAMGERVFAKAAEPKEFWRIPGGDHSDFMWRDGGIYARRFFDYLDQHCPITPDH